MIDKKDVLICLGSEEDTSEYHGAVLPPIAQASLFRKGSAKELLEGLKHEDEEFVYTRGTNPTVKVLESRLAALERGESCKCFASGIAAISAVFTGLLKSGDHILFINNIYGPTLQLAEMLTSFGVEHDTIHGADCADFEGHIRPNTKLIFFESPGTMLFRVVSISAIARAAKERGILTCIDNSVSTPLFQKPIPMGIDLVVHSCTKYISGHSDVVGGALITSESLMKKIFFRSFLLLGGIQAPFDAWLLLRGLLTLPTRMRQHQSDGLAVAKYLADHKRVRRVFHPLLSDADSELVSKQMTGYSGLFSAELDVADFDELCAIVDRLRLFGKAVSWGGVESLVIPSFGFDDDYHSDEIPKHLVRFSTGLEGADSLIADLEAALD
ncbi:MAG: aminotransferase class I/II-fold pyridoxal phosphate-dependent enzyme [Acidobacteriota bacterium]|nr:aminotransferase class I/II-fold pyridoxal phosphate-dependent enzyme [Acidobacteriota bacterium]MDH3529793.1 aminotransferase class I/II-fold pyridoxal phosphate-dependent enzyme [Acidobacteriota bacterium]